MVQGGEVVVVVVGYQWMLHIEGGLQAINTLSSSATKSVIRNFPTAKQEV